MNKSRKEFESFIENAPHYRCIDRFGESDAWAGCYRDGAVELAWQAWKAQGNRR